MADPKPDRDDTPHAVAATESKRERRPRDPDDELLGDEEAIVDGRPADLPAVLTRDTRGG